MKLTSAQKTGIQLTAVVLGLLLLTVAARRLSVGIGHLDFQGYWSAAYLLSQSEDFTDDASLLALQRSITRPDQRYVIKTWNPPWLLAWLLPLTLMPFDTAVTVWLIFNTLLLGGSAALITWHYAAQATARWKLALPLLAGLMFPSGIVALLFGQVNVLVLAGLVGYLVLAARRRDLEAGMALALTLAKPHVVYLTATLVILTAVRQRRWRIIGGLAIILLISTAAVFFLRPTFLTEYWTSVGEGRLLDWQAASLPAYLQYSLGWPWIRYTFVVALPLAVGWWFWRGRSWSMDLMVDLSIMASVITMPFGWSYDFVVLLLPLSRLVIWLIEGFLTRVESWLIGLTLLVSYLLMIRQRIASPGEMDFFWIPIFVALLYGWALFRLRSQGSPATVASAGAAS
jgi:hypothetical protein